MSYAIFATTVLFAEAAAPAGNQGPSPPNLLIPMLLIGVLFYFMLLRPERRRRAETNSMLEGLKKNDRVLTIGGIYGTVVNLPQGGKDVVIKIDESSNTRVRILRSAISKVVTDEIDKGTLDEK